jgi:hypothetical protein
MCRAETVHSAIFLLVTIVSLWLLWRARQNAETFGRRALLPYTVVLFSLGTIVFVVTMWLMQFALELTADGQHLLGSTGQCQGFAMADLLTQVAIFMNDMLLVSPDRLSYTDNTDNACRCIVHSLLHRRNSGSLLCQPCSSWLKLVCLRQIQCGFFCLMCRTVFATMTDWRSADPQGSLSGMNNGHLTLAWLISSVAFNVLVTTTIAIKLWPARADTHKGGQRASSAIDILVESAAAYTVTGVLLIVSRAVESDYAIVFNQLFGIMAVRFACVYRGLLPG